MIPDLHSTMLMIGRTAPPPDEQARSFAAFWMFVLVASLLVLFIGVVAIVALARASRRRASRDAQSSKDGAPAVDPWKEAANRVETTPDDLETDRDA